MVGWGGVFRKIRRGGWGFGEVSGEGFECVCVCGGGGGVVKDLEKN